MKMQTKSLVTKYNEGGGGASVGASSPPSLNDTDSVNNGRNSKNIIHPFIRAYCRKLDDYDYYRNKFIQIALTNLIEISHKSHRRDSFAVARNEFIADLPHYESALKLVCEVCRGGGNSESSNISNATNGDCENREGLLALLEKNGVLANLSDVFNFLYHVFSSAQFELFLIHFLDSLLDLIPKSTASGLDHHVIIKSHKIRSSDFFKKEELTRWIEETANELEGASPIAKAHFYYSKVLGRRAKDSVVATAWLFRLPKGRLD